jgi:hypothetical protein
MRTSAKTKLAPEDTASFGVVPPDRLRVKLDGHWHIYPGDGRDIDAGTDSKVAMQTFLNGDY